MDKKRRILFAVGVIVLFLAGSATEVSAHPTYATETFLKWFNIGQVGVPFNIEGSLQYWIIPPPGGGSLAEPFSGQTMKIFRKKGIRPWKRIGTLTTDAVGGFSMPWTENSNGIRRYKAVYSGNATVKGSSYKFVATFF
ncbi:MAG: hypothetical protein LUO88_02030 [Methanoregulaceae archaeon]|nr:hypothetical protein [Methanoregulaceae archaeon]